MLSIFLNLNPIIQALIATIFTWLLTAIGASIVFFFKDIKKNIMDIMLSISSGIMIAASYFSLLKPAIEMANNLNMVSWFVVTIGFISGGLLIFIGNKIFDSVATSSNSRLKRMLMLVISITLHNIPEGLAVGVSFGSLIYNLDGVSVMSSSLLALGIGIQNLPEGGAVSIPLRREGLSRRKSFIYGQLSGIVEPICGVLGALVVLKVRLLLPFLLSFAAGAMIYVVTIELIPESQTNKNKDLITIFTILGFSIMMVLDVALG